MLAMQTHNKVLKVKYGASVVNCRNELIAVVWASRVRKGNYSLLLLKLSVLC